ncbi:MAG: N-6 DNA methylase [Planctomycetia bacterium]|nr:N-6 DNA methylase [Planctomycetia bacterium]
MAKSSETRTEGVARELLEIRGWNLSRPPKGNLLWKNEYRDYPHLLEALSGRGKKGRGGDGYPDFLVVTADSNPMPLIVGEAKASEDSIDTAVHEACNFYGEAFTDHGMRVLAAGIAGNDHSNIAVQVSKRSFRKWRPIEYREHPIQWLPTPEETNRLLTNDELYDLQPRIPSGEVLARRADEINRILRECKIKDEYRPAVTGAFMLALWQSKGQIRMHPEHILTDINSACKKAFIRSGKIELAESILVPEANEKLAVKAPRICYILRLLNVTTLTAEHDYLGQLYETFFRFTGGNTIGQFFTPRHVTRFVVDLCEVNKNDVVVDPTCGTGGFLIAALYKMMGDRHLTHDQISDLVRGHLAGFESEPITAALCVANMILRGDGTTGIYKGDCFSHPSYPTGKANVVVGNPPFPHKKTDEPSERFVDRALEALDARGTLAMIVPESLLVKPSKRKWRKKTLAGNSLRAVMTLPGELFQPYAAATTAILILEKGVPHNAKRPTFFCRITNDGYRLQKNVRLERAGEQLSEAMDAYRKNKSIAGFCVWGSVDGTEWSPGNYIEGISQTPEMIQSEVDVVIRSQAAFHATFAPQLSAFRALISSGEVAPKSYAELIKKKKAKKTKESNKKADTPAPAAGTIGEMFDIYYGQGALESKRNLLPGAVPIISSAGSNNGCYGFFEFSQVANAIAPSFVTVPKTGSIGEAFVQEWPCGVTSDCLLLMPKNGTDQIDLYIAAAMVRLEKWRFNYGRKITPTRVSKIAFPRTAELREWVATKLRSLRPIVSVTLHGLSGLEDASARFKGLADEWRRGRGHKSTVAKLVVHPAYQQIIGMGEAVVPLLLREMELRPSHWSWALRAITGTDPVPESARGKLDQMATSWVNWGKEQGYIW